MALGADQNGAFSEADLNHREVASEGTGTDGRASVRLTLLPHAAAAPGYETEHAAGMDLRAAIPEGGADLFHPGRVAPVPTGIRIEIPPDTRARCGAVAVSRSATRWGCRTPGTIDADYRGEVTVLLLNWGTEPHVVRRGDRIAQLVIAPVVQARLEVAESLTETARGGGRHTGR